MTINGTTETAVDLQWNELTGASSYRVYGRATGAQNLYFVVTESPGDDDDTTVTLTDTGASGTSGTVPTSNTTGGAATFAGTLTVNGTLDANGTVTLGDGGDAITLFGTALSLTANGTGNDITLNLVDNNTDALDIQQGSDNYINIDTTDSSEAITFGNANTNPNFTFLGSGIFTASGVINFGGAASFEIPNSPTPTVDEAGELALDTTIADHTGLLKYYDGTEELTIIGVPTGNLTTTDSRVLSYNATNNEFEFVDQSGGGGGAPTSAQYVVLTADATLTDERVLTGTVNQITLTDGGANSTITLSLPQDIATSSAVTFAT